jgi:4-amino-4-deoxy-L-arabinose transferase-like glycosyltransferase
MSKVAPPVGLLAIALIFVVLFWRLGTPTFWDPDEAHYAETSREMLASGDWWAPHYNEQPFFDKPVLFHQLQAVAMRLFADPELGARFVPASAALLLVAITGWFSATLLGVEVAIVAGLILVSNPGVFGLARYAILDTLFTMFLFGAAACISVAALGGRPRLQWMGYVSLALAIATKGPVALVLCGLALLVSIAVSAELRRQLLALHWAVGLLIVVVLSAPPFLYLYLRFGQDFVSGYLLDENLKLFTASRFRNQPGYGFYFQILALGLLPWTGLLVGRLIDNLRAIARGERLDSIETLLWTWPLTITLFFTLSTFKLDHYVFPAVPALCVLCARGWSDVRARRGDPALLATRAGCYLIGPLLIMVGAGGGYLLAAGLELPWGTAIVPAALFAAGVLITIADLRGATPPSVPWRVLSAMLATYAGLILFVLPSFEQRKVVPEVAAWVDAHAQPTDRIASYRLNRWSPVYRYYVNRHTTFLETHAEAAEFLTRPEPYYCLMRHEAYEELVAKGLRLKILHEREGLPATSGRALWRGRNRLTRFVVVSNVPK